MMEIVIKLQMSRGEIEKVYKDRGAIFKNEELSVQ